MSARTEQDLDLRRILARSGLADSLEHTAKFYECGLVLLDKNLVSLVTLNCAPAKIDALGLAFGSNGKEWRIGSPCLRTIRAYGYTVGVVATDPADPDNGRAAEALAEHVATMLTELASQEYELDDLSQEILDSYEEVNLFYDLAAALKK